MSPFLYPLMNEHHTPNPTTHTTPPTQPKTPTTNQPTPTDTTPPTPHHPQTPPPTPHHLQTPPPNQPTYNVSSKRHLYKHRFWKKRKCLRVKIRVLDGPNTDFRKKVSGVFCIDRLQFPLLNEKLGGKGMQLRNDPAAGRVQTTTKKK